MFISRLKCAKCHFQTPTFVDSHSIQDDTHTFLFRNAKTGGIRIAEILSGDLHQAGVNLTADRIDVSTFAEKDEAQLEIPWGKDNVQVATSCPNCGEEGLIKIIEGIQ